MSDYLCKELIFEIFIRLPPKSLLRFRSLSKSLYYWISSPRFISMHTFRSPKKLLIRHAYYNYSAGFYTVHSEDQFPLYPIRRYNGTTPVQVPSYIRSTTIAGSCNGIFCLFHYQDYLSLWNFSIRPDLTLPDCPLECFSGIEIGFGFDPLTNDFKIVVISTIEREAKSSFVYTMKTNTWSVIDSPTPTFCEVLSKACFVNGALHWVVERYYINSNYRDRFCIVKFDLSTHDFDIIALPEPSWKTSQLTTVHGSLAVISRDNDDTWIWVRRDGSWFVFSRLKRNHVFEGGLLRVLQLTTNGDLLFLYEGFQVYNPKTGVTSTLVDFDRASCIVGMETCIETLQLLDHAGTAIS